MKFKITDISPVGNQFEVFYSVYFSGDAATVEHMMTTVNLKNVPVREYSRVIKYAVLTHYDSIMNGNAELWKLIGMEFDQSFMLDGYNKTIGN